MANTISDDINLIDLLQDFCSHDIYEVIVVYIVLWICISYITASFVLYGYFVSFRLSKHSYGLNVKRSLFVIAHPDDECMFFGPTILGLLSEGVDVHIVCLSEGNFDGKADKRRDELWEACASLGIPKRNITLLRDPRLPDDPKVRWSSNLISEIILHHLEAYNYDSLITFDICGVSNHANHCAIYCTINYMKNQGTLPEHCAVYALESVNIFRKYWSFLDLPYSCLLSSKWYFLSWSQSTAIVKAMKRHSTQMVWFRYLYLYFSRYVVINTLKEIPIRRVNRTCVQNKPGNCCSGSSGNSS